MCPTISSPAIPQKESEQEMSNLATLRDLVVAIFFGIAIITLIPYTVGIWADVYEAIRRKIRLGEIRFPGKRNKK